MKALISTFPSHVLEIQFPNDYFKHNSEISSQFYSFMSEKKLQFLLSCRIFRIFVFEIT